MIAVNRAGGEVEVDAAQGVHGGVAVAVAAGQAAGGGGRVGDREGVGREGCLRHGDDARNAGAADRQAAVVLGPPAG